MMFRSYSNIFKYSLMDLLCNHSNTNLLTLKTTSNFSSVKICFRANTYLVYILLVFM